MRVADVEYRDEYVIADPKQTVKKVAEIILQQKQKSKTLWIKTF